MLEKPKTSAGYTLDQVEVVKATCLYVARILGDLMLDLVVVGGLVPTLLVDQEVLPAGVVRHVGTADLDVGLAVALFDESRYQALSERLRQAGFVADRNPNGNPAVQRWKHTEGTVTIDFLVSPLEANERGGSIRHLETDFGAIVTPGLPLAFRDHETITLTGRALNGARGSVDIRVCGPGAFIVLKALAFQGRNANKDAYDLYYVLRNYGSGIEDVRTRLAPLLDAPEARSAVEVLHKHFLAHDGFGPWAAAEFITGGPDDDIQAEVVALVEALLKGLNA